MRQTPRCEPAETAQLTIAPYAAPGAQSPRCANMGFPSSRPTLILLSAAVPLGTNLIIYAINERFKRREYQWHR